MEPMDKIVRIQQYRLAAEYTARYQQIVMKLPPRLLFLEADVEFQDFLADDSVSSVIHAYIDLCAEQLQLYKCGVIPEEIWENWKEGILRGFRLPAVRSIWENYVDKGPFYQLANYLSENS